MRHFLSNITSTLTAICLLLVSVSCETSDNVEGIFTAHQWIFTGFCYTPNIDSNKSQRLSCTLEGYDKAHLVSFQSDGSIFVTLDGCKFKGSWIADGTNRSFAITNLRIAEGNDKNITPFAEKFLNELKASAWYRGDTNYLQLFDAEKHYYLLFGPTK